jgi:hypothetical protein
MERRSLASALFRLRDYRRPMFFAAVGFLETDAVYMS